MQKNSEPENSVTSDIHRKGFCECWRLVWLADEGYPIMNPEAETHAMAGDGRLACDKKLRHLGIGAENGDSTPMPTCLQCFDVVNGTKKLIPEKIYLNKTHPEKSIFPPKIEALMKTDAYLHWNKVCQDANKEIILQKRLDHSISNSKVRKLLQLAHKAGMSQKDFEISACALTTKEETEGKFLTNNGLEMHGYGGKLWHYYMKKNSKSKIKAMHFRKYVNYFFEKNWLTKEQRVVFINYCDATQKIAVALKSDKPEIKKVLRDHPGLMSAAAFKVTLDIPVSTKLD